jgi:hypothetical protein
VKPRVETAFVDLGTLRSKYAARGTKRSGGDA